MSRILYVYDGKMSNVGIDAVVRRQLETLVAGGYKVDLVARGPTGIEGVQDHVSSHSLANLVSWLPRRYYYGAQRRMLTNRAADLFQKNNYSLVIAWPQRALALFRVASRRVPCLLNCDTVHFLARRGKNRESRWPEILPEEREAEYADARLILVPSEYSRGTFLEHGVAADKLFVLGRGIDPMRFHPPTESRVDQPFRLVFCGRVTERKGIRQIIAAWRLAALPNSELVIVGEVAEDARELLSETREESIRFLHFLDNPATLLRNCDAQILLSRTEGMAKSLLEGAASGLATLATRESGFPLEEGVNGYFVERKRIPEVAEKLRLLHGNRSLCQSLGQAGRDTILKGYTTEHFNRRFLEAVRACLTI